jgi:hypothetical protein
MRLSQVVLAFFLGLVLPAVADTEPSDCKMLIGMLKSVIGQDLTAPPAGDEDGWCVLDGAVLTGRAADQPDIAVKRLRLRGTEAEGVPVSLDVAANGLRVRPKIGDKTMDDRLRSLLRLQTADLRLSITRNDADDRLELRDGRLVLSGGTEVEFKADIAGAEFSASSVLLGRLTSLDLRWKNDGRLLRPAMEAAGEALVEGAKGSAAIDAAREALAALAGALPTGNLAGDAPDELEQLIAALPQGRGWLSVAFVSEGGIGAAQLGLAALSENPMSRDALAQLLAGSVIKVDWQPGLAP